MEYLLCYLLVGFSVAFLMAHLQKRRGNAKYATFSFKMMLGAYLFIALAWPISIAAFIYGAFSQFLLHTQRSD